MLGKTQFFSPLRYLSLIHHLENSMRTFCFVLHWMPLSLGHVHFAIFFSHFKLIREITDINIKLFLGVTYRQLCFKSEQTDKAYNLLISLDGMNITMCVKKKIRYHYCSLKSPGILNFIVNI